MMAAQETPQENMRHRNRNEQERAQEIIDQVRELWLELEGLIITPAEDGARTRTTSPSSTTLVGQLVEIIKGKYSGRRGRVTKRRGTKFWYILLESNGQVVYKQPHNFRVIASTEL